jgi:hypothetical protein
MHQIYIPGPGDLKMSDYLVCPDLYEGSSLSLVMKELTRAALKLKLPLTFVGDQRIHGMLHGGILDDPQIFLDQSLTTLTELVKLLKCGDRVLFGDFFQPMLPMLHYYLTANGTNVIYGSLFHGASFVQGDYFSKFPWLQSLEECLLGLMKRVYVPSRYASSVFDARWQHKVRVCPFGFDPSDYYREQDNRYKTFDVVMPHRWTADKGAELFVELIRRMPEMNFAVSEFGGTVEKLGFFRPDGISAIHSNVTVIGGASGISYLEALKQSKIVVAAANQEFFGYSLHEAMASGCIAVCARKCCYPEFLPTRHLFESLDEAEALIRECVTSYPSHYIAPEATSAEALLLDFFAGAPALTAAV